MRIRPLLLSWPALVIGCFLTACTMGPNYERPPVPQLEEYREEFPTGESVANIPWWDVFEDSVLVGLIEIALENNRYLRTTLGRIEEARAQLGVVRSDLFPRIDYGADGGGSGNTKQDGVSWDATGALSASYQVDLWGRIRRSNEAALQGLLATEEAYRGLTITLVGELANAYLLLRDLDDRLLISEETLKTRRQSLEVIQARFDAGMVSEVDVSQAEIQVFVAEVSVQTFLRLGVQTENAISSILGLPPGAIERGLELEDQILFPEIPTGLPSELIRRRPDVLEAERILQAQTAKIGVAEALKFPQFNLLADLGAQYDGGGVGFFDIGAQVLGPLFNAGQNQRRVDVEVARAEQLVDQYEQAILDAYGDVADAMIAVQTYDAEFDARMRQVASATKAADLSWVRYEGGLTSFLEVLDLQRSLFNAQLASSEARQLRLTSMVSLYTALGGGWVPEQDSTGVFEPTPVE